MSIIARNIEKKYNISKDKMKTLFFNARKMYLALIHSKVFVFILVAALVILTIAVRDLFENTLIP